jgi:Resolvase, N terminal domain
VAVYRPGYEEAMRLVDARAVDAVLCFKWDRFIREPLDLEYLIPRFDKAGVRFAEVDGNIDLGTDSGRLHARILIAMAKAEQERKAERQKLANEQAAINGKRFMGTPRPFGYLEDHVTAHPVEGPAVAEACAALLGGGSISGIRRGVDQAGPPAAAAGPARHHDVEPDQHPDDPFEPEDRRAVGLPWGNRRARAVGAAGARRDVAGGARNPRRPHP